MIPYRPPSFLEECVILSKRIEGKKRGNHKMEKEYINGIHNMAMLKYTMPKMVFTWEAPTKLVGASQNYQ